MKQKVLFILHLPPPIHGAAIIGKYILESDIIKEAFEGDFINLSTSQTLNEIGRGGFFKIINLLKIQFKVIRALFSNKYDLCYITIAAKGVGFYKDLFIVFILKFFKIKIIYHFHNKGISSRQANKLDNLLYKFTFKNTKIILLSECLYYDITKYMDKKDVFYCPNGILPPQKKILLNRNSNQPCRLLFLSNMMVEKGALVLLEACRLLKKKEIKFECQFVGAWSDISEKDFNTEVLKNDLSLYVTAYGQKYHEDKNLFFEEADVFVFPTFYHNECFPLVLLEAMQYSLPIISTPEGGIADIVLNGETGFLTQQQNVKLLTEKLELLILNPTLRESMGTAGKKRFDELFTMEKFENNLINILKKTLAK